MPLVYALTSSGVFQPFWSCQGHADANGEVYRLPQVWFYANSQVHVQLLIKTLSALTAQQVLAPDSNWQINLTYSDDELLPAYSLAPHPTASTVPDLVGLQQEIPIIAEQISKLWQVAVEKLGPDPV